MDRASGPKTLWDDHKAFGGQKVHGSGPHEYQQHQRAALYTLVTSEASKGHKEEKGEITEHHLTETKDKRKLVSCYFV